MTLQRRPSSPASAENASCSRRPRTLLLEPPHATLAAPWVSRAQQLKSEYKLSVVGNRPIPLSDGAFVWADLVNQRSNGRINVKVYPGSQLVGGDQTRELVAMRQGIIDMCVSSTINLSPQIKEMTLFSMPFLMPDHKAYDALIGGEVGQDLFKVLASRDVVPLSWGENGFRELSNSKRAVRKPMTSGQKIATPPARSLPTCSTRSAPTRCR